jgi:hypothetical protein
VARLKPPFERSGGGFTVNISRDEREVIGRLMDQLRALLTTSPPTDDRIRRLFPAAYHAPSDRELDEEYQRLMRDELATSRLAGLDVVAHALAQRPGKSISSDEMMALLQALNSIRLVLGTLLDISEEDDLDAIDDGHPLSAEYHLYEYLNWLLDWAVRTAQEAL